MLQAPPEVVDSLSYRAINTLMPGSVILTTYNAKSLPIIANTADNIFVSIIDSHRTDAMPTFLLSFNKALLSMGVPHCILTQEALIPQPPSMLTAPLCIDIPHDYKEPRDRVAGGAGGLLNTQLTSCPDTDHL
ncbi:hypothetical protein MVEN_00165100 [Mycena venus]|uniref:Uncharacterized protein n=1 Tax=Mycena venus TaxID=2733690 RepID=A0A8H7DAL3_9AGAR|nr:hypothetical protein MVEN_00165100 [Mycena venus]